MNDARESVEKMVESSTVFYPGHDLPFKLDGKEISYLDGPTNPGNHHVQRGWAGTDDKLHGALGQGGQPQPRSEGMKDPSGQAGNR